jgi:hypothetical protein
MPYIMKMYCPNTDFRNHEKCDPDTCSHYGIHDEIVSGMDSSKCDFSDEEGCPACVPVEEFIEVEEFMI